MEDDIEYALQLASSSVLPVALKVAIDLGVFNIIQEFGQEASLSSAQIFAHFPHHHNHHHLLLLDSILNLLTAHSILTCSPSSDGAKSKTYGLAPVARYFTKKPTPGCGSMSQFVSMIQDKLITDMWCHLKDAVLEGGIVLEKAYKMNGHEFMRNNPSFGHLFKNSMTDFNALLIDRILEIYDGFKGINSLVDVGGGDGSILRMVISKHPSINGINFDLPAVIETSISHPAIKKVAGDMFDSIPNGDSIFMKWVLRCWEDNQCVEILKNCIKALPSTGKVIVVDMVLPEMSDPQTKSMQQFHLFMASMNPSGHDRTEQEFMSLGARAGFSRVQVVCSACNFSILEFIK